MASSRRRGRSGPTLLAVLVATVLATAGVLLLLRPQWLPDVAAVPDLGPAQRRDQVDAVQARQLLDRVPVKGRAPKTGYERDRFGSGWATVRGCDMRNRILARDLVDVTYRPGTRNCVVATGTLHDLYTGATVPFTKGERTSTLVQIDHRYPLALAWQQGAQAWTEDRREQFANDPTNLQAVEGEINQEKGASGPGSWLPPNKGYRCQYVTAFVEVAHRWQLSMNPGDHRMAQTVLDRCSR